MYSERDTIFSPSPGEFRSLSASPRVHRAQEAAKDRPVDFTAVSEDGARARETRISAGEVVQHLFPEVIVHTATGGGHYEGEDTSDCSFRGSPTKVPAQALKLDPNVHSKRKSLDRLGVEDEDRDSNKLDRSRSKSAKGLSEVAGMGKAKILESRSDSNLRHKDERPRSSRKVRSRRSFTEYDIRSSGRRDPRECDEAEADDDELAPDLTALPMRRDQRHKLLHQHTVDSYLRPRSNHRRAEESGDYPWKERHAASFRRSSTSPVPVHGDEYEDRQYQYKYDQRKRSSAEHRQRYNEWEYDRSKRTSAEHSKHKSKQGHRQQSAKEKRGMFKRNETVAAPASSRSHRSRSKRWGHARLMKKGSSVDVLEPELYLPPPRAHSDETLDLCHCQECVSSSSRPHSSRHSSRHRHRSDSVSSAARHCRRRSSRDKPAMERRDVYRHHSPRNSDASGRTLRSPRTSGSLSSRAEQVLKYLKTSSSESERLFRASSKPDKLQAYGRDGHGVRHRGIDALGSSTSDRDLDLSRRELFMKFFSQEVDLDDTFSPEEPRFFLAPEPVSLGGDACLPQFSLAEREAETCDGEVPVLSEQLTVASYSNGLAHNKRSGVLTSKCSVIMYDDDLRSHSGIRSLSVSHNASPNRTPTVKEPETPPESNPHSIIINVEDFPSAATAANHDSSSASSEIVQPKNSDPSSLLSVTDTDSAVSSAASRQTSPCFDVVYASSGTTVTQPQAVPKALDSAYQTKESSVDMFETFRDTRRRKSVPTAR